MISPDEYVARVMNSLRYRRLATLHNGEKGPSLNHATTCPCATNPHTQEEMGLLALIEQSISDLLAIYEATVESGVINIRAGE